MINQRLQLQSVMLTKTSPRHSFTQKPGSAGPFCSLNPQNTTTNLRFPFPPPCLQNPTPMALSLSLSLTKSRTKYLSNPSLFHLFSSSSSPPPNDEEASETPIPARPKYSSYLSDVKASLMNKQQTPSNQNPQDRPNSPPLRRPSFPNSNTNPQIPPNTSLQEIKQRLSAYRSGSSVPPPHPEHQHVSFLDIYEKREMAKQEGDSRAGNNANSFSKQSFDHIRESLRKMKPNLSANTIANNEGKGHGSGMSVSPFRLKPENEKARVIGGTEELPMTVFGKEMKAREKTGDEDALATWLVRDYTHDELGEKLRKLRPKEAKDGEKKGWFSLGELNERLRKLREQELEAIKSRGTDPQFMAVRTSLLDVKIAEDAKKNSIQRLTLLGGLDTPDFMLHPPKEHLVEKYFHPDNMSASEKLKIELAKVRDEFKLSESDCGSARVQVAQLTTKIKHLSSVLHKKDKHSRKGLIGMVQKRKKLLKYLRGTDWDSYCFVLSKLGLRDNPDYKTKQ